MNEVGLHAPHERFPPGRLLALVQQAEKAGFSSAMCSDHFHPWSKQQGQSGQAWAWLGAALATTRLSLGTVTAPGQRYHPAVVAQVYATLAEMFPERVWVALGTGQWLNESINGERWPSKEERRGRLLECIEIIRALWAGETVTHHGSVKVEQAHLFTRPANAPLIFAPALTAETAEWAGRWADGLLTGGAPPDRLREMIDAFHNGGGHGKPVRVQACHYYCEDESAARRIAHETWRWNVLGPELQADLQTPAQFEAAARFVRPEDMHKTVRISSDAQRHIAWLRDDFAAGVEAVYVNHVGTDPEQFVDRWGEDILPHVVA